MAKYNALGIIETFGLVNALQAADAMEKAANVELVGYENVGSGYISILVAGDIAACRSAVDAGVNVVTSTEGTLHSSLVIANPHPDMYKIIDRYRLENILPKDE